MHRNVKDLRWPSIDDAEAALGLQIAREFRRQRLEQQLQAEEETAIAEEIDYAARLQRQWRTPTSRPLREHDGKRVDPVVRELAAARSQASALEAKLEISEARALAAEAQVARLSAQLAEGHSVGVGAHHVAGSAVRMARAARLGSGAQQAAALIREQDTLHHSLVPSSSQIKWATGLPPDAETASRVLAVGGVSISLAVHLNGTFDSSHVGSVTLPGLPGSPEITAGGRGLNSAFTCARLGVPTRLVGLVGHDAFAGTVEARLRELVQSTPLLDTAHVLRAAAPEASTSVTMVLLPDRLKDSASDEHRATIKQLTVPCTGANQLVGHSEVQLAAQLLAVDAAATANANAATPPQASSDRVDARAHGRIICMLGLDVPLAVSCDVAAHAAGCGGRVALQLAGLVPEAVFSVHRMLASGHVHVLVASVGEARMLLNQRRSSVAAAHSTEPLSERLADAPIASQALFQRFPSLEMVLLQTNATLQLHERTATTIKPPEHNGSNNPMHDAEPPPSHALVLPVRRLDYAQLQQVGSGAAPNPAITPANPPGFLSAGSLSGSRDASPAQRRGPAVESWAGPANPSPLWRQGMQPEGAPSANAAPDPTPTMERPTLAGGIAAMYGGLVSALSRQLNAAQTLVWGYAARQLCMTQHGQQLEGSTEDLLTLAALELVNDPDAVNQLAVPLSDEETKRRGPLTSAGFLRQTRLHQASLLGSPSFLPRVQAADEQNTADGRGPAQPDATSSTMRFACPTLSAKTTLTPAELSTLISSSDSFGFTPLQRAMDVLSQTRKDTLDRRLVRRIIDWLLTATALLAVLPPTGGGFTTNPLLTEDFLPFRWARGDDESDRAAADPSAPRGATSSAQPPPFVRSDSKWATMWNTMATRASPASEIFASMMAQIKQLDGATLPQSVDDATARLAAFVVMGVLDDVARRRKESTMLAARNSKGASGGLRRSNTSVLTELDKQILAAGAEFEEADKAELNLIHAFCLPVLRAGLEDPAHLSPFCRQLLACRDPFEGRSLLLLASGVGLPSMVELLLDFADLGMGHVDVGARSFNGATALHEAAAAKQLATCKILLSRTPLKLTGPSAETTESLTPLSGVSRTFAAQLMGVRGLSNLVIGGVPSTTDRVAQLIGAISSQTKQSLPVRVLRVKASAKAPTQAIAVHNAVAACSSLLVLLTPELLLEPLSLVALVAAYDMCSPIIGLVLGADVADARPVINSLKELAHHLTEHHPQTLQQIELLRGSVDDMARKCHNIALGLEALVIPLNAPADGPLAAAVANTLRDTIDRAEPGHVAAEEAKSKLVIREFVAKRVARIRTTARVTRKEMAANAVRLRQACGNFVVLPDIDDEDSLDYHMFLSHQWWHGQDICRVIKLRLAEMAPGIRVFLDVDDLKQGRGAEYVDRSMLLVVCVVDGYFTSPNCIRELLRAMVLDRPVVSLVEPDRSKGGLTRAQIHERLETVTRSLGKWGLAKELAAWGLQGLPSAQDMYNALFSWHDPIEWSRLGPFQDVTLRLLAECILDSKQKPTRLLSDTVSQEVPLPPCVPARPYHVFVSTNNPGAAELIAEVQQAQSLAQLRMTSDASQLRLCRHMLVYLTAATWTSGSKSDTFAKEVEHALEIGIHLLLAHEMPNAAFLSVQDDYQSQRKAVPFDSFLPEQETPVEGREFSPLGAPTTPQHLIQLGIYSEIAVPLKSNPFRRPSMELLAHSLADDAVDSDDELPDEQQPVAANPKLVKNRSKTAPALPMWLLSTTHRSTRQVLQAQKPLEQHPADASAESTGDCDDAEPKHPALKRASFSAVGASMLNGK